MFYNTTAAGVIVVLNKRKPAARRNQIVLLNDSRRVKKGRPKNYIPDEEIKPLAALFLNGEAVAGEVAVITREQAEAADYNLSPSRWVGQTESVELESVAALIKEVERLSREETRATAEMMKLLKPLMAKEARQ